jgi:hypothetical protein
MCSRYKVHANKYEFFFFKYHVDCKNKFFFLTKVEDIQRGLTKPLQEMMFSSGDEDSTPVNSSSLSGSFRSDMSTSGNPNLPASNRFSHRRSDQPDEMDDEEEDDEDYEDEDDN